MNQGKLHALKVGNPPDQEPPNVKGVDTSGGNSGEGTMGERLARLEGAFSNFSEVVGGLRHAQNLLLVAVVGVGAILATFIIGFGIYTAQRIDALPTEFEQINSTLSNAITAAKQQPSQIIVLPQSAIQPPAALVPPQPTTPKK